ncbi:response regulator [Actinomadura sp. HBU206391]|uniref:response regulator n=1 Tax=Actinomadura sp. HBU206391 TaxID=2731692 RepID=UPI00164FCF3D|nr:response regulator [Actinomadura sp. HBU206391]MBC6462849.1 response regulator [Actinomadura sp. HBU206391]
MIRTLVVEDDPLIADAHRAYVERVPGFTPVGVVHQGGEALRFLAAHEVDLVLLDFYLPDMGGLEVCRVMRAQGHEADVVAVTSARDLHVVRAAVSQGVVLYLLKPFTFASFRDKLQRYADYHRHLAALRPAAAQHEIDQALAALRGTSAAGLPKGLSADTLGSVVETLRDVGGELSAAQVGAQMGISRVTARRYLEHLADQGLADRQPRYGGAGRPEHSYQWRPAGG